MSAAAVVQASTTVPPRGRVTQWLRDLVATTIASSNLSVFDVAAEYGVSTPNMHKPLMRRGGRLPTPKPTRRWQSRDPVPDGLLVPERRHL